LIKEAIEKLAVLLQGKIPAPIDTDSIKNENERDFAMLLNRLFVFVHEMHEFILPLAKGELDDATIPPSKNFLASPFKELHSHLQHLTWQAKQVAQGDYGQRVDFMGEFSDAFNFMITSLDNRERQLRKKINELKSANSYIKNLEGILPICMCCKKIKREGTDTKIQANWVQIESYISQTTRANFSHGICPECMKKHFPEFVDKDE
jgi:hypothetical protein